MINGAVFFLFFFYSKIYLYSYKKPQRRALVFRPYTVAVFKVYNNKYFTDKTQIEHHYIIVIHKIYQSSIDSDHIVYQ